MRSRLFVGSSFESVDAAEALKRNLDDFVEVHLWSEDVFRPTNYTLDELIREARASDLAVLLFTPDDLSAIRDTVKDTVRDNVIFNTVYSLAVSGETAPTLSYLADPPIFVSHPISRA